MNAGDDRSDSPKEGRPRQQKLLWRVEIPADLTSECVHGEGDKCVDSYYTDPLAKRVGEGRKNVKGRYEPFVQPVIAPSSG